MLSEICIENLAVIKQAVIPFTNDFNVFTGETGAGKSILINGINAVLGKRINKDIVRSGCDKAVISALFTNLTEQTRSRLGEFGIECPDDELLITREISADGGSIARINSKTSAVSVLREIGVTLVDVHGQHDNQILMFPEKHIHIVDSYGGISDMLADYQRSFKELQAVSRSIKKLSVDEKIKQDKIDLYKNTVKDISELDIKNEHEDKELEREYSVANNSSMILNSLKKAALLLSGDEDNSGAAEACLIITDDITDYCEMLPELSEIKKRLDCARIELNDIGDELVHIADGIEVDEERLLFLENRRDELNKIKKKYGPELSDVLSCYNNAISELKSLVNSTEEIQELYKKREDLLEEVSKKAAALSEKRKEISAALINRIEDELRFLDMPNVRFSFSHTEGKLTNMGMDNIEMLISVNAGEELKPISKVASGGELSRIMLAIKNVIAEKDEVPTLIFDEIDTGVSGRAAQKIGVKLREISRFRQVLCVTHLSQIAVMADNHLLIEKNTVDDHTFTNVCKLDEEQRKFEIARILSGEHISEAALAAAEEQLSSKDKICTEIIRRFRSEK